MRSWILLLILAAPAASALTLEQLEAAKQDADRAKAAAGIDLSGGPAAANTGCLGSAPGGISLLGVQSQMGPAAAPIAKLSRDDPAMLPVIALGKQMGLYGDAPNASAAEIAQNDAAHALKAQHDTYAQYLDFAESGTDFGVSMAKVFAWMNEGRLEELARAYGEYHKLALQYAPLYTAAEAVGKACP